MSGAVLLVGGFGLPSAILTPLARELDARIAPTGFTVGCGEREARKVIEAIEDFDEPVTLVGHSRGGQLARVASARRPNLVRRLVTVGTPASIGPPSRWGVPQMASVLRHLPLPVALDCATAPCCSSFRDDLERSVPVPWTAIISPTDRIVTDALVEGADDVIRVRTSHLGLVSRATGRAAIVEAVSR